MRAGQQRRRSTVLVGRRSVVRRVSLRKAVAMILVLAALAAAGAAVWLSQGFLCMLLALPVFGIVYVLVFHTRWCYVALRTAPRDLRALFSFVKIVRTTKMYAKQNLTIPDIFHETVSRHPDKHCFLFQDEVWTFKEVEDYSLRVTAVLKAQGVKKDTVVGLLFNNCPQQPAIWMGNARLGGISPLINTNQKGKALVHSINIAKCDMLIFSEEYQAAVQDVLPELNPSLKLFKFVHRPLNVSNPKVAGSGDAIADFTNLLETTPPAPWTLATGDGFEGKLLYIYTSGTTGLPKAAVISNARFVFLTVGLHHMGLRPSDRLYCPLPLYHTAGGVISVGQALLTGCTVIIKTKFSATQYFPDCVKYEATGAHYIGEMCRYILATPNSPADKQHKVRVIYGNGLRLQIWNDFITRFNIKQVLEFYGATEGNANIVNTNGTPGAIGFVSRIFPSIYPIAIIKVNQDTGEPVRNGLGLCQLTEPNEPGVFIGKIVPNNAGRQYLGYVDKSASEKKVVRNVFTYGDAAFISGDIIVADDFGYLYFRDRTGDTFRWRGENVSTTEVEAAISRVAEHRDAVVYGVLVPNIEGRAGMCGIVDTDGTLDLDRLNKDLARDLPVYARPVFIRVMSSMDMTGTFKMKKTELQKVAFNPELVKDDKLYYLDLKQNRYLPLHDEEYSLIINGLIRL